MTKTHRRADRPIPAWLPPTAAALLRAWGATWRVRARFPPEVDPHRRDRSRRCVYLFWHQAVLLACYVYRDLGVCIAQSQHRDGEIAARIAARFGHKAVRGSSTRGATGLIRAMIDFASTQPGDIAFTPDGPKGPARTTKPGALYLAGHLGWLAVPVALTARPRKELSSWDRFMVPWPFAKVGVVAAEPIEVEKDASTERLEQLSREVDRRMVEAERVAEELVA